MDGIELLEQIRADERIASTRIIVLSSVDGTDVINRFKALNANEIMTKPARSSEFRRALVNTALVFQNANLFIRT